MALVAIDEVQGNVLSAYGARFRFARYVRLTFRRDPDGVDAALSLLRRWYPRVTFGRPARSARGPHVNVAFSYLALKGLRLPASLLQAFPEDFRQGARRRAALIGDSWPERGPWPFCECDILFAFVGTRHSGCDVLAERLLAEIGASDGALALVQDRTA